MGSDANFGDAGGSSGKRPGNQTTHRVFVTCGTDHHRFDRVVDWVDEAIVRWRCDDALMASGDIDLLVQHGASRAPKWGQGVEFLTGEEMAVELRRAAVVICSAGPGAVMDARNAGRRPIVVARHAGEAVDGHQMAFAAHIGRVGLGLAVESSDQMFHAISGDIIDQGRSVVAEDDRNRVGEGVAVIGEMIDRLVLGP